MASVELLPKALSARLEEAVGARIVDVQPRGGGGASRSGAELTLAYPDGRTTKTYLSYRQEPATAAADAGSGLGSELAFRREVSILRGLSSELASSGVRAPGFLASEQEYRAILTAFTEGEPNYNKLKDDADRRAVGYDFMAQLAALHAIDLPKHPMDGFSELRPAGVNIRSRLAELRKTKLGARPDPLLLLAINWLEANVPPEPERLVVLHGDAGPANFLFADGKVTALLDWELAHYGDPMADLAMVCIRNLFQPFIPLKDAFAAYEAAGGAPVDLDRVRYYRLFFQTQFASPPDALNNLDAPPPPAFGSSLMYATIHMRVLAEALAEAAQIPLAPVVMPQAPLGEHHRSFMLALDDLKDVITPRLTDTQASAKSKALARLVKWWRDLERWGPAVEAQERAELSAALGEPVESAKAGRALLVQQIADGAIDVAAALQLCRARTWRDAQIFADGLGGLANTGFAPLD